MVLVLLKSLRSDVPQGLYAKNTHENMGACRHTHIHMYMTWDAANKHVPSAYLRVSNAPSFDEELYNSSKRRSKGSYLCKLTNKQKLPL